MDVQQRVDAFTSVNPRYDIDLKRIELEENYAIYQATIVIFGEYEESLKHSPVTKKVTYTAKAQGDEFIKNAQSNALNGALDLLSVKGSNNE